MQLSEFKAWFEGFTESMSGTPTKKQFDRIKERVAEIDGKPIVQTVWLNDYHRYDGNHYYPYNYPHGIFGGTVSTVGMATTTSAAGQATSNSFVASAGDMKNVSDTHAAMFAIGKAEAMN